MGPLYILQDERWKQEIKLRELIQSQIAACKRQLQDEHQMADFQHNVSQCRHAIEEVSNNLTTLLPVLKKIWAKKNRKLRAEEREQEKKRQQEQEDRQQEQEDRQQEKNRKFLEEMKKQSEEYQKRQQQGKYPQEQSKPESVQKPKDARVITPLNADTLENAKTSLQLLGIFQKKQRIETHILKTSAKDLRLLCVEKRDSASATSINLTGVGVVIGGILGSLGGPFGAMLGAGLGGAIAGSGNEPSEQAKWDIFIAELDSFTEELG